MRIDSTLPRFTYTVALPTNYADSVYTPSILYPEFVDMAESDIEAYHRLSSETLPKLPAIEQQVVMSRRQPNLQLSFCPLVYRNGRYQILASFMLRVDAKAATASARRMASFNFQLPTPNTQLYAPHSVLSSGRWVKIRVPSSGIYQLSSSLVRQAGFSDINKVKIYGYGGNLQDEVLDGNTLKALDDLPEVEQCIVGGKHLFYAKGPVSWSSNTAARRTRNFYSDYGYYFLTESNDTVVTVDSTTFLNKYYPTADDYHSLYEVDGYSWYHGGRNLFDSETIS
ncbi:MAG TPA: Por secretion system protein, partial [Prevotella sp.]|nr:Por secretion system protein [Prevotella sp.]